MSSAPFTEIVIVDGAWSRVATVGDPGGVCAPAAGAAAGAGAGRVAGGGAVFIGEIACTPYRPAVGSCPVCWSTLPLMRSAALAAAVPAPGIKTFIAPAPAA